MAGLDLIASPGLENDEPMVRGLPMNKSKIGETTFRRITVGFRESAGRVLFLHRILPKNDEGLAIHAEHAGRGGRSINT
jgi:hypothetical protein